MSCRGKGGARRSFISPPLVVGENPARPSHEKQPPPPPLPCTVTLTSQAAVVGAQGGGVREHEALGALLAAGGGRAARRTLEAAPSAEVAAGRPGALAFAQVLLVVLGEQRVEEGVDAAVAVGQAGGQVVDVAFGLVGDGQRGVELAQQLPDPEGQEAGPEEQHYGEDEVQHLESQSEQTGLLTYFLQFYKVLTKNVLL